MSHDVFTLGRKVMHNGALIEPIEARRRAADLLAAATLADGIDCANAWHNTSQHREQMQCPECRRPGASPVAHVETVRTIACGEVFFKGRYWTAEKLDNGKIIRLTTAGNWVDVPETVRGTFRL